MKYIAMLLAAVLLIACSSDEPSKKKYTARFFSFGTIVDVSLFAHSQKQADTVFEQLSTSLNKMHKKWHAWENSPVTAITNACKKNSHLHIKPELKELLRLAKQYHQESDGLFDPAAGSLIRLWGFFSNEPQLSRPPPSQTEIKNWLANRPTMEDIFINGSSLSCSNKALELDLGGFAKGYGVGQLMKLIKANGIDDAVLSAGGDLQTIGQKPDAKAWHVAIDDPSSQEPLVILKTQNESIFSSGTSIRRFEYQGKTYHHILNPKTGYPATEDFLSVTVIDSDPARADAAATALLIAGEADYQKILAQMQIKKWLILTNKRVLLVSPGLKANLLKIKPDLVVQTVL